MRGAWRNFTGLGWLLGAALPVLMGAAQAMAAPADGPSYIVVDADSGDVLAAHDEEVARYPASLTKMMTLYLTFEALRDRRIGIDQLVPVSRHAASMEPTKLGLVPGTRITVRECILGMLTRSANDAAAAMGEMLGGNERAFAQMMTLRAHSLGMADTYFRNASGLPDAQQVTTAHDMAVLARRVIDDFPEDYAYFSVPAFVFHGQTIYGHDPLLASYPGADGMKTGFTNAAGYNIASSARREGRRLIGIVLGAPTSFRRNTLMVSLLDQSFAQEGIGDAPVHAPSALIASARAAEVMPAPTIRPAIAELGVVTPARVVAHAGHARHTAARGHAAPKVRVVHVAARLRPPVAHVRPHPAHAVRQAAAHHVVKRASPVRRGHHER
jgi:D-alanyl-D-alanine carboxypeptidase